MKNIPLLSVNNNTKDYYTIKLNSMIGHGAYGSVFDSNIEKNNKIVMENVAVKIIVSHTNEMLREIKIAIKMGNSGIGPKIYYWGITKNKRVTKRFYKSLQDTIPLKKVKYAIIIVMQKLKGHNLDQKQTLTIDELGIICKKINKMHSLHYIHNDLHVGNIFIDEKEPYIIDYGLSQYIDPNKKEENKRIGNYMNFKKEPEMHFKNVLNRYPSNVNTKQYCIKAGWACETTNDMFKFCMLYKAMKLYNVNSIKVGTLSELTSVGIHEKKLLLLDDYILKQHALIKSSKDAGNTPLTIKEILYKDYSKKMADDILLKIKQSRQTYRQDMFKYKKIEDWDNEYVKKFIEKICTNKQFCDEIIIKFEGVNGKQFLSMNNSYSKKLDIDENYISLIINARDRYKNKKLLPLLPKYYM